MIPLHWIFLICFFSAAQAFNRSFSDQKYQWALLELWDASTGVTWPDTVSSPSPIPSIYLDVLKSKPKNDQDGPLGNISVSTLAQVKNAIYTSFDLKPNSLQKRNDFEIPYPESLNPSLKKSFDLMLRERLGTQGSPVSEYHYLYGWYKKMGDHQVNQKVLNVFFREMYMKGVDTLDVGVRVYNLGQKWNDILGPLKMKSVHTSVTLNHPQFPDFGLEIWYGGEVVVDVKRVGNHWFSTFESLEYKELKMGTADAYELRKVMEVIEPRWQAVPYDLLTNNCNHFSDGVLMELRQANQPVERLPVKYNRIAKIGSKISWALKVIPSIREATDNPQTRISRMDSLVSEDGPSTSHLHAPEETVTNDKDSARALSVFGRLRNMIR